MKFINELLKTIGRKDLSFIPLNYNFKKLNSKDHRHGLNSKTLREVLSIDKSPKNKNKNKDYNAEICEKIEKECKDISENILSRNFLYFFDKIFYKNNKKINMKEFGFDDLEVDLENIKLFGDLLLKEKDDPLLNEKMDFHQDQSLLERNETEVNLETSFIFVSGKLFISFCSKSLFELDLFCDIIFEFEFEGVDTFILYNKGLT